MANPALLKLGLDVLTTGLSIANQRLQARAQSQIRDYEIAANARVKAATNETKAERGKYLRFIKTEQGKTLASNYGKALNAAVSNLNMVNQNFSQNRLALSVQQANARGQVVAAAGAANLTGTTMNQLDTILSVNAERSRGALELATATQRTNIIDQLSPLRDSYVYGQGGDYDQDQLDFTKESNLTPQFNTGMAVLTGALGVLGGTDTATMRQAAEGGVKLGKQFGEGVKNTLSGLFT